MFLVCVTFQLLFMFLALKYPIVGIFGILLGLYVVGDLAVNGLTEVIGYVGSSEIVHSFDIGVILIIPIFLVVLSGLIVMRELRG